MCGRFTLSQSAEAIASVFQLDEVPILEPRYNIAPTQLVPTVLQKPEQRKRQLQMLRWGLIPAWAKDPAMGARLINARAETVTEKPSFRSAFRHRRCLVIADGFYEWQRQNGKKQPFYFRMHNAQPFAFAGLWERWQDPNGEIVETCTILTTDANELLRPIHDRMPVILDPKDYDLWLDPAVENSESLQQILHPYSSEAMTSYAVSTKVNNPGNDTPECINSR
ncbi:SOS response-associated peptidase [Chroococcidiopsis sp. CCMEE 29]|uniref:SOS response-associated peptidase n=1 Tax=Chroococcidiopsis sp. CCMEE 29 TaxID=155894 RepID=UPI002111481F|nr:SOS response-associated peptidase [Chroococcidiopsis sp. CCMEE 29]